MNPDNKAQKHIFLLVDDSNTKLNFGTVSNMNKIKYNLNLLGEEFKNDLSIYRLLNSDEGSTTVFDIGRFITILRLSKKGNEGSMTFMDFNIDYSRSQLERVLLIDNTPSVVKECLKVYDFLSSSYSPEIDRFSLKVTP